MNKIFKNKKVFIVLIIFLIFIFAFLTYYILNKYVRVSAEESGDYNCFNIHFGNRNVASNDEWGTYYKFKICNKGFFVDTDYGYATFHGDNYWYSGKFSLGNISNIASMNLGALDLVGKSHFFIRSIANNSIVAFLRAPNDFYVSGLESFIKSPEDPEAIQSSFKVNMGPLSQTLLYIDNTGILHYKLGLFNENKPLQGTTSISAGNDYTCAISSGNLYCWGKDSFSLGSPIIKASYKIGFSNIVQPTSLGDCIDCFGFLKLPDHDYTEEVSVYSAYRVNLPGTVSRVSLGSYHTCAISNGNVYCWGLNSTLLTSSLAGMKQRECSDIQNTYTPITPPTTPSPNISSPSLISSGDSYSMAVSNNSILKRWGGYSIQTGTEYGTGIPIYANFCGSSNIPNSFTSGYSIIDIASRKSPQYVDGCYVANSKLYCWTNDNLNPSQILSSPWLGNVSRVVFGANHACAIVNGNVYCWGDNSQYQLGVSGVASKSISDPQQVLVGGIVSDISAGYNHTCVVLSNGVVKCWGQNYAGETGDTTNDRSLVTTVTGISNATKVAAGRRHTCAIVSNDNINNYSVSNVVKCWGAYQSQIRGNGINCQTGTFSNWSYNVKHPQPSYVTIPDFYQLAE